MPLFRFVFEEGTVLEDVEPMEFPDHETAIESAKQAGKKTLADAVLERRVPSEWVVRIYNEQDELISTVFVADLLRTE